jgi:hypothetical protein
MPGSQAFRPSPDLPPGGRSALVIATSRYSDTGLSQLRAPGQDATDLAATLADPAIGGFTVTQAIDQPEVQIRRAIGRLCSNRTPDELILIYLSCHGLLDARGQLYFAASDTEKDGLGATAIKSTWLLEQLDECRARRQIVILDCCFSGAFAAGAKGDLDLGGRLAMQGRGRAVLTASRGWEYSFEGAPVDGDQTAGSIFTTALVEGLRTGAADSDHDGHITLDDVFQHAEAQVLARGDRQTPQRWMYGAEGSIVIARNPAGIVIAPAPIPQALRASLDSPYPDVRIGAVRALAEWLVGDDPGRVLAARDALADVAANDAPAVAAVARGHLATVEFQHPPEHANPGAAAPSQPSWSQDAPRPDAGGHRAPVADDQAASSSGDATVTGAEPETPLAVARTGSGAGKQVRFRPRKMRTAAISAIGGAAVVAAAVALFLSYSLGGGHPGTPTSSEGRSSSPTVHSSSTPAIPSQITASLSATFKNPGNDAYAVALDRNMLAVGSHDEPSCLCSIHLWDIATKKVAATFANPQGDSVRAVAFGPGATTLAAGDFNGSTYLWDLASRKVTATLTNHHGPGVLSVAFGPGGTTLAAGDANGSTYLWDVAAQKLTATLTDPGGAAVGSIAFSPGGGSLAAGDGNGSTYLWDVATRKLTATLTDPGSAGVHFVAFSPGGTTLAAGDANGSTYLWDVATRKVTATLTDPGSGDVDSVAFGHGGATLAAGDANGSTYLWDVATRKVTATLTDPQRVSVNAIAFAPEGTVLAAGGRNGSTYLWRISG